MNQINKSVMCTKHRRKKDKRRKKRTRISRVGKEKEQKEQLEIDKQEIRKEIK